VSTSGRLWFHVERVFSQIEGLCIEARAADLLHRRREAEPDWLRVSLPPPPAPQEDEAKERFQGALELLADKSFRETHTAPPDLVVLRSEIRKRLVWLKARLAEVLTEREVYYCLFPLVVYTDELVFSVAESNAVAYEPLQSELYEIDNGGELFYTLIEDLLRKDETLPIIFEIFYFCLNDGFLGLYESDKHKREEYKNRLSFRIPVQKPAHLLDKPLGGERSVRLVPFPTWYYVGAAAAVVVGFVLLSLLGHLEVALQ
jgi:type VI protein secretion system component VasF